MVMACGDDVVVDLAAVTFQWGRKRGSKGCFF
jgi:hypothetical protein